MEQDTEIVIMIVIMFFFIAILWKIAEIEEDKDYYKCLDTFGNEIICEDVSMTRAGIIGTKSDGTEVYVVEYKKCLKSEE